MEYTDDRRYETITTSLTNGKKHMHLMCGVGLRYCNAEVKRLIIMITINYYSTSIVPVTQAMTGYSVASVAENACN